jgi:hypothetical protein
MKAPDLSLEGSMGSFSCYGSFLVFLGRRLCGVVELVRVGSGCAMVGESGFEGQFQMLVFKW